MRHNIPNLWPCQLCTVNLRHQEIRQFYLFSDQIECQDMMPKILELMIE